MMKRVELKRGGKCGKIISRADMRRGEKDRRERELMYVPDIIPHLLCYSERLRQTENAAEPLTEKLLLAK